MRYRLAKVAAHPLRLRMSDTKKSQSELIAASLRLADQTLRRVIDAIEPYLKQADERGPSGQLTKAAKDARQRLKNPELNITVPSVSLQKAIPNALIKAAKDVSARLFEQGVFATAIVFPTVPKGTARIRAMVSAAHSREDLDKGIDIFVRTGKDMGVLEK